METGRRGGVTGIPGDPVSGRRFDMINVVGQVHIHVALPGVIMLRSCAEAGGEGICQTVRPHKLIDLDGLYLQ